MKLSRHFSFLLLAALGGSATACSAMGDRDVGPWPEVDGGLATDFVALSDTRQVLLPGSSSELTVQYLGNPSVPNQVEFAVVALEIADKEYDSAGSLGADAGAPGGSLQPPIVFTEADGKATTTLTVGTAPGRFQVRARMIGQAPVFFDVEVSQAYRPQLSVFVKYDGLRTIASWSAAAIPNLKCENVVTADRGGAEVRTVDTEDEAITFSLAPQQTYAVVAWGRDGTNAELASGCQEITAKSTADAQDLAQKLEVSISDKPMELTGTSYPVEIELKVDASMARLAAEARSQVEQLLPAGANGEAKAYLTAVHDVLFAGGDQSAANLVTSSGDSAALATVLTANKAGYLATASALSTLLTSFGKNLAVQGNLGVGAPSVPMTLGVSAVVARSDDGKLAFDLMNISGGMAPTATITAQYDKYRAEVGVETLSITLGLGTYGGALLDALGKDSADWYVSRFSAAAGCSALSDWLQQDTSVQDAGQPVCDRDCAAKVCSKIIGNVISGARTGFTELNDLHSTISLTGKVSAHERDDDGVVDDLGPSPVTGNWGKASGADKEDAVSGDFGSGNGENSLLL